MRRRPLRILAALGVFTVVAAACGDDSGSSSTTVVAPATTGAAATSEAPATAPVVVASTSWVAAFASMAGATDIRVIAPNNIQHPPDYDPKPSDLADIAEADFILLAGFEGFAKRMQEAAGSTAVVENVATDFDPAKLGAEVLRLAEKFGTDKVAAQQKIDAYTAYYEKASTDLKAALAGSSQVVVAQAFVANWAVFAGFTPVGTYGPMPASPSDVATLVAAKPTVVFENQHMGGGADVVAATGAIKIDLINFPGDDLDLTKVIATDVERIMGALMK